VAADWQKQCRSTKGNRERPTSVNREQAVTAAAAAADNMQVIK
jgi:hypothetical protein